VKVLEKFLWGSWKVLEKSWIFFSKRVVTLVFHSTLVTHVFFTPSSAGFLYTAFHWTCVGVDLLLIVLCFFLYSYFLVKCGSLSMSYVVSSSAVVKQDTGE